MRDLSRRVFVRGVLCLTVLFAGWQVAWAFGTPAFRTPDEPLHLNSIVRVAEDPDPWPAPGTARLYASTWQASEEAGLVHPFSFDYSANWRTWPSPHRPDSFTHMDVTQHDHRIPVAAGETTDITDQMTQHPPLYYAGGALVLRGFGAQAWPWDRQVLLMRLYSIFLTLPLVPCLAYSIRRIGVSRRAALIGSLGVFAVPQLAFISASVTNDALAIGAGALTMAAVVGAMFGPGRWSQVMWAGSALGLLLWSKGTVIPLGLVVVLGFVLNPRAGSVVRRVCQGVSAGVLSLVIGGFWWARNVVLYGRIQPEGFQNVPKPTGGGTNPLTFLRLANRSMLPSFWGKFGWMEVVLANYVLYPLILISLVLVVLAFRRQAQMRWRLANLLLFGALMVGMLGIQSWHEYRQSGWVSGVQGRYLFAGIVGFLVVMAAGWASSVSTPGEISDDELRSGGDALGASATRVRVAAAVLPVLAAVLSLVFWLRCVYAGPTLGVNFVRWADVAGVTVSDLKVVIVAGILLVAAIVVLGLGVALGFDLRFSGKEKTISAPVRDVTDQVGETGRYLPENVSSMVDANAAGPRKPNLAKMEEMPKRDA